MNSVDASLWKIDTRHKHPLSKHFLFGKLYTAIYPGGSDPALVQRIDHKEFEKNKEQVIRYVDCLLKIKKSAALFLPALKEIVQTDDYLYIVFYSPPKLGWKKLKKTER